MPRYIIQVIVADKQSGSLSASELEYLDVWTNFSLPVLISTHITVTN